jgi:uncharacterized protein (TIGR03437 family)
MSKVQKTLWGGFGCLLAIGPAFLNAHIAGPAPRYTAAPGDAPLACSSTTCHTGPDPQSGPINAYSGYGVSAVFSSGCTYTPGVPVTITVTVTDPVNTRYGFQMTARLESDLVNGQAGDFTPGDNQIVICDLFGQPKGPKGCPASQPVQFIEHSFVEPPASSVPYTFTWMPPASNVGNIHFYVAGNAVNNNDMAEPGDHISTNSYVLTPAQPDTPAPTVATGGVTNAASFAKDGDGHGSAVAPGSLVTIFGTNLGTATADASAVPFSTCLGAASVSFNGITAPVRNVSPSGAFPFINAQVPFQVLQGQSSGSVPVVVSVNGVPSAPQLVPVVPAAPGIFTIPPGVGNAILVNLTDFKVAAPVSANLGVPTRPIRRGEKAYIYATGLGALNPPLLDGFNDNFVQHDAKSTPIVWIGGTKGVKAPIIFAGQAPPYPGVNQINITIPDNAPTGAAVPLQIQTADGSVISPAGVATIAIE